jgi:glycosyltransferase involved in cell wall biosynthesis
MVGAAAAGSGTVDWNDLVMRQIGAAGNIEYLGARPQSEINALMARSHVFVNTSISEGFPNTFIQAWMREVPVVSLDVDPDGVLDRERVGIHARTTAGLVEAVRGFVTDPQRRADYGERARRYAMRYHSMHNAKLLTELIDTGSMQSLELPAPALNSR